MSLGTTIPLTPVVGNVTYFPFGGLQQVASYNGVARFESDDLQYRVNGLFLTQGAKVLMQRFFAFADHLNITELNNSAVDSTQTQDFNYDPAQRLTPTGRASGNTTRSATGCRRRRPSRAPRPPPPTPTRPRRTGSRA